MKIVGYKVNLALKNYQIPTDISSVLEDAMVGSAVREKQCFDGANEFAGLPWQIHNFLSLNLL